MKKNRPSHKQFISAAVLSVVLCMQVAAAEKINFKTLYEQKKYDELCKQFESHETTAWLDADTAYYYAIALLALGKSDKGLHVCKEIRKPYPGTKAASLATSATVFECR